MLKVELFVMSFWIFQEISPFWSWRGISSMSWAHKTHSLRGIYTQPSCSAQAAEKKIGLVLLHSFKLFSFLSFYRFDAVFLGRLTMAAAEWCWFEFERNLFAPIPSLPYYCGCRQIMESTFHIFCLWHPHFDLPMFQCSRAEQRKNQQKWWSWSKLLLWYCTLWLFSRWNAPSVLC